jgi:tetratricopeptide (TPR) repeat protein
MAVREEELRTMVAARPERVEGYTELASLLYESGRFQEAVETLKAGLAVPLTGVARATLLTALGWYVNTITHDVDEPLVLGELALAATEGLATDDAPLARAYATSLIASCVSRTDLAQARGFAASALLLLNPVLDSGALRDGAALYEAFLEAARLNCLLGRSDEAATRCGQAQRFASDAAQRLNCLIELGTIYREAGRLTEARKILQEAVTWPGASPFALLRPYYDLGLTEKEMGKHAEARSKFRKVLDFLRNDPVLPRANVPELLRMVGHISYEMEDVEEAARLFQAAADAYPATDPFHWTCLLWTARCQCDLGQIEAARGNAATVKGSPLALKDERDDADALLQELSIERSGPGD